MEIVEAAGEEGLGGKRRSVAFPSISTGVYGYPIREAAEVALRVVREWFDAQLTVDGSKGLQGWERVVLCVFSEADESVYREVIP